MSKGQWPSLEYIEISVSVAINDTAQADHGNTLYYSYFVASRVIFPGGRCGPRRGERWIRCLGCLLCRIPQHSIIYMSDIGFTHTQDFKRFKTLNFSSQDAAVNCCLEIIDRCTITFIPADTKALCNLSISTAWEKPDPSVWNRTVPVLARTQQLCPTARGEERLQRGSLWECLGSTGWNPARHKDRTPLRSCQAQGRAAPTAALPRSSSSPSPARIGPKAPKGCPWSAGPVLGLC